MEARLTATGGEFFAGKFRLLIIQGVPKFLPDQLFKLIRFDQARSMGHSVSSPLDI